MGKRKYRSNQGRHPKKENESLKIIGLSFILIIATTIVLILTQ